jgi:putative membrane protein
MMYDGFYQGNGTSVWSVLLMVLMMVLVILGIILAIRYLNPSHGNSIENSALSILKVRYAKGEVDKKEYEQLLKDLKV